MSNISIPNTFSAGTLIQSAQVNSNFLAVANVINAGTASPTASTIVYRDANSNTDINNIILNETSTVTAAGTTTLTAASSGIQIFTGTTTQIVSLPDATTLALGHAFRLVNRSTGAITVKDNGANTLLTLDPNNTLIATCTSIGSTNGVWDIGYNSFTLTGDVTTSRSATSSSIAATVASVGGSSASNIHSAELAANAATNANTVSTIVKRDGSGNFSAGTITATLSGNASTVTTNANLTGPITSVGNATSVASQTGTGSKFVMDTSPTLVTPLLGTPTSCTLTNCTGLPLTQGLQVIYQSLI